MKKNHNLIPFLFSLLILITKPALARDLMDAEKEEISKTVRRELIDPESARFKWVPVSAVGAKVYCGLVNSKNRLGGYTGDAPYAVFLVWIDGTIKLAAPLGIGSNDGESPASIATRKTCDKEGYTKLFMAE